MNRIELTRANLRAVKPRSVRRVVLEKKLVQMVTRRLQWENRKERSRQIPCVGWGK